MTLPRPLTAEEAITALQLAADDLAAEESAMLAADWITTVLGCQLADYQSEIANAVQQGNVAVAACHSPGKTFIAARIVLWWLYTKPDSIVITTAPTDRQVEKLLWGEIRKALQTAKRSLPGRKLNTEIQIGPRHFATGFTAPPADSDKFGGFHSENVLLIVDEASGVGEEVYKAIDGITAGGQCRILLIGNPLVPEGRFYKIFREQNPRYRRIHISAFDTPNFKGLEWADFITGAWCDKLGAQNPYSTSPQWVADMIQEYGDDLENPFIKARILGQFPESDEFAVFPLSALYRARSQRTGDELGPLEYAPYWIGHTQDTMTIVGRVHQACREHPDCSFGVDVARSAHGDESVIMRRPGRKVIFVDVIGVGAGVYDRLRENPPEGYAVRAVNVGAGAKDSTKFANLKAEIIWRVRQLVLAGERTLPNDDKTISQFAAIRYAIRSNGKIEIEDKQKLKGRVGYSPDRADAAFLLEADASAEFVEPLQLGGERPRGNKWESGRNFSSRIDPACR